MNTIAPSIMFAHCHFFFNRMIVMAFLLFFGNVATSQPNAFTADDFYLSGDAVHSGDRCFQLTDERHWEGGALWFKRKIDLSQPFEMELSLSFGCNDDLGADGMVFIFHPYLTTGFAGEGMGFGGLYPSLGIEMDTYQNYHLDDPAYDHVAIVQHGTLNHSWGLSPPITLNDGLMNIEDCQSHKVKITWQPEPKVLRFFFDGSLRIKKEIDLIKDIFEGVPEVYWGFTSATGDKINKHMVCMEKLEFTETFALSKKDQTKLLDGDGYILRNVNFPSGSIALPQRARNELDNLALFFKKNPSHTIILEAYTDSSGNASRNEKLSRQRAKAIADYLKSQGINPERILHYGHGEKNPIAPNTDEIGRRKNRRVELRMRVLGV